MAQARIPIPGATDPLGVLTLATAVAAGITTKGAGSLITGELATGLKAVAAEIPDALAAHKEAKDLEKKLEKLYEKRDAIVAKALLLGRRFGHNGVAGQPGQRVAARNG